MFSKKVLWSAMLCSVMLFVCPMLFGQANGSFSGTVTDRSGSVITGAKVTITSQGTGVARESTTDASGHFVVPFLPVASYTLKVEAHGFQTVEQKDARLQVNESRELDFSLAPASVTEAVEVSASAVAVETTDPTLGQVITSEQVAELPLNGRNFVQLATLSPGVNGTGYSVSGTIMSGTRPDDRRPGTEIFSNGNREGSNDFLYDGVDDNDPVLGKSFQAPQ